MQGNGAARAGWKQVLAVLALLLVVAGVYWPGLRGGWLFDDFPTIVSNTRLHLQDWNLGALWRAAWSFDPGGTLGARPLAMASFALNHLLGGLDPWGYKLGGLLVHLVNTLLVYRLLAQVLSLPALAGQHWGRWAPWAIALAWAVHPLQVSSVLYVVQRMETLGYTFMLLCLLCYLRARVAQINGQCGIGWLTGCVPLLLLALACKENAVLVPVFTLALELSVLGFGAADARLARWWRWLYVLACVAGLVLFVLWALPQYWRASYAVRDFGSYERLLSQMRILPQYLGQMLLPNPAAMSFYYDDFAVSRGWLAPWTTLAGALLLASLLVLGWLWRKSEPLLWLGVLWFFAGHALTSNIVPLELVFEHRNYFAWLGVLLVLAVGIRRFPMRDGPALKYLGVGVLLFGLSGLTLVRSLTWAEPLLLASELAAANPQSGRASSALATVYYEMADGHAGSPFNDFALAEFDRGSGLPGASIVSDQGRILLAASLRREVPEAWWQQLLAKLERGPISPETTGALFGLLGNRLRGVPLDDAYLVQAFVLMFEQVRLPGHSYAQFADYALNTAHEPMVAEVMFGRAIALRGDDAGLADRVIASLREQGHVDMAERLLQQQAALASAQLP